MQYSFTCPLEGCGQKITVEAESHDEAAVKLASDAREHLGMIHPELQKTDEQVHSDVESLMVEEDEDLDSY
ncbi:MAG: hypothetical protein Q7T54_00535 [Candidatus Levybacteria bacterium]|nr:hypothetical protein [Candidatus Levybacteria bacterium]